MWIVQPVIRICLSGNKKLWLIDHGASLYFHHSLQNVEEQSERPFVHVKDHVLLPLAAELDIVDAEYRPILSTERICSIVSLIPDEWLIEESSFAHEKRQVYIGFLETRVAKSEIFVKQAKYAREALI